MDAPTATEPTEEPAEEPTDQPSTARVYFESATTEAKEVTTAGGEKSESYLVFTLNFSGNLDDSARNANFFDVMSFTPMVGAPAIADVSFGGDDGMDKSVLVISTELFQASGADNVHLAQFLLSFNDVRYGDRLVDSLGRVVTYDRARKVEFGDGIERNPDKFTVTSDLVRADLGLVDTAGRRLPARRQPNGSGSRKHCCS